MKYLIAAIAIFAVLVGVAAGETINTNTVTYSSLLSSTSGYSLSSGTSSYAVTSGTSSYATSSFFASNCGYLSNASGFANSITLTGTTVNSGVLLGGTLQNVLLYGSVSLGTGVTIPASKISGLSAVATSGSYGDLLGLPTLQTGQNYTLRRTLEKLTGLAKQNSEPNLVACVITGDSTAGDGISQIVDELRKSYGDGGRAFDSLFPLALAGGATANTNAYTISPSGNSWSLPTGGSITFSRFYDAYYNVDTMAVYFVTDTSTPGTNKFKLQSNKNGAGWVDETVNVTSGTTVIATGTAEVDCAFGSVVGAVATIPTKASTGYYKFRVVGVSGTAVIAGGKMVAKTLGGVVECNIARIGSTLDEGSRVAPALFGPWMYDLNPTLVSLRQLDGEVQAGYLSRWTAMFGSSAQTADFLLLGTNPTDASNGTGSQSDFLAQDAIYKAYAQSHGWTWWSPRQYLPTWDSICSMQGWPADDGGTTSVSSTSVQIQAAATRSTLTINNTGSKTVWIGSGTAAVAGAGQSVAAGGFLVLRGTDATPVIHAICSGTDTSTVKVAGGIHLSAKCQNFIASCMKADLNLKAATYDPSIQFGVMPSANSNYTAYGITDSRQGVELTAFNNATTPSGASLVARNTAYAVKLTVAGNGNWEIRREFTGEGLGFDASLNTLVNYTNTFYTNQLKLSKSDATTTGNQTQTTTSGKVKFAAGATSLTVSCAYCLTSSNIQLTFASNDATADGLRVVAGYQTFTIYLKTAPTAETTVNWNLTN